jgi:hypothetical protein
MFGPSGALDVDSNEAGGVRAVLALPYARTHLQAGQS